VASGHVQIQIVVQGLGRKIIKKKAQHLPTLRTSPPVGLGHGRQQGIVCAILWSVFNTC